MGLKGKVVNIGNPGSGQRGTMEELMKAMGVDNSFFKSVTELTSSEQVKALCDGKIDAFGYSVGFPNGAMEQAATCAAKAMPINLTCLLYTSPSPRDRVRSRMPSSA